MQHVDLLTAELRPRRDPFTVRELLLLWGILLLALLLWSAWQQFATWQLEDARGRLSTEVQKVTSANTTLAHAAKRQPDAELVSSVAELKAVRREQALLKQLLSGVATSDGFSDRLEDLARFKIEGLWLESLSFAAGGAQVRLAGYSETAARVPQFLAGLSAGPGFKGYNFDGFELRDGDNDLIEFEVTGPELRNP